MSESIGKELKINQEVLNILQKYDGSLKLEDMNFKTLEDVWNYLLKEEENVDAQLNLYKSKNIDLHEHMEQLHQYNNIKDITQQVFGSLANLLGTSVNEIHCKFNLEDIS